MITAQQLLQNESFRVNLVIYAGYFGCLVVLNLFKVGILGLLSFSTVLFLLGGVVGMFAEVVDRLVNIYYVKPNEELSIEVKKLLKEKKWIDAWNLLQKKKHHQHQLTLNNVLFMAVWSVLALFLVTSSPSSFGKGLVLGVGLNLIYGLYVDWEHKEVIHRRLFWPIKRQVTMEEMNWLLRGFVGVFALLSLIVVF